MNVSVVIPSFNRGEKIRPTIEALLHADLAGIAPVEIIVVDDGSLTALEPIVTSYTPPPGVDLRCLWQANSGPAAARNTGFRQTRGDIVLFIDDDIVLPPNLINLHVTLHRQHPGSVICGPSVPPDSFLALPEYDGLNALNPAAAAASPSEMLRTDVLAASGHLSVERKTFAVEGGVYKGDLETPAAEEMELTHRLRQRGIPVLFAMHAVAIHLQPIDVRTVCRQQYKHGRGVTEALVKHPHVGRLPELLPLVTSSRGVAGTMKGKVASNPIIRSCALYSYLIAKRCKLPRPLLREIYRTAVSCWYIAGLRAGSRRYAQPKSKQA
jgi:glycosyltransferase involved in cell wall biosynthesis